MSDEKKSIPDEEEIIQALSTEYAKNDDIIDYITDNSFDALKKRFGTAEEDASIRDEDFNPLSESKGINRKNNSDDSHTKSSFRSNTEFAESIPTLSSFGSAESDFDNDAISFNDIDIDSLGNILENDANSDLSDDRNFDTHKKIVFFDEQVQDGIRRNTDTDVSEVFSADE